MRVSRQWKGETLSMSVAIDSTSVHPNRGSERNLSSKYLNCPVRIIRKILSEPAKRLFQQFYSFPEPLAASSSSLKPCLQSSLSFHLVLLSLQVYPGHDCTVSFISIFYVCTYPNYSGHHDALEGHCFAFNTLPVDLWLQVVLKCASTEPYSFPNEALYVFVGYENVLPIASLSCVVYSQTLYVGSTERFDRSKQNLLTISLSFHRGKVAGFNSVTNVQWSLWSSGSTLLKKS